ncbi:uncharacterized protein VNE69_11032 [Vairimorpha necatrix]|uniref:Uncharacterized protein n=1 Tax=Vairimorpha necatrix TaxID=6039 RepID=A0AAX4JG33_9MICR
MFSNSENCQLPFLNIIPNYISDIIDNFIFKIPNNIKNLIIRFVEFSRILIGGIFLYVPFVYLFNRDYDLEENDLLSYKLL